MGEITQLKKGEVDSFPVTKTEAVYDNDGNRLDNVISNISSSLNNFNGDTFYFDYKDGQYGFNTSSERGADTFHPFSNTQELYEALQYSGLVTPEMTFDEMCQALANRFPQIVYVINPSVGLDSGFAFGEDYTYPTNYPHATGNPTAMSGKEMVIYTPSTTNQARGKKFTPTIDVTRFNMLSVKYYYLISSSKEKHEASIDISDMVGNKTLFASVSNNNGKNEYFALGFVGESNRIYEKGPASWYNVYITEIKLS